MSTTKKLENITTKQITDKGVHALANRPNASDQYGVSGLSPTQLKLWFDKLATFIANKINELQDAIFSDDAAAYIRLLLDEYGVENLDDLIKSFSNGGFAGEILQVYPSVSSSASSSLQSVINNIAQDLSENAEGISSLLETSAATMESTLDTSTYTLTIRLFNAAGEVLSVHSIDMMVNTDGIADGSVTTDKIASKTSIKGTVVNMAGAPTTADKTHTVGTLWIVANETLPGELYQLKSITDGVAKWEKVGADVDLSAYLTREQADESYVPKLTGTARGLYCRDHNAQSGTYVDKVVSFGSEVNKGRWTIVQRDGSGYILAKTPTADNHVANKAYVDAFATLAKGASNGLGFETVAKMNAYINSKKLDSYEGTIAAGSYIVLSADFETTELPEYAGSENTTTYTANLLLLTINGEKISGYESKDIPYKSNRYYYVYQVTEDCDTSSIYWSIQAYNGAEGYHMMSNSRLTVITTAEPAYEDIAAYDIPYATSLYIEDVDVPDYWWGGAAALPLETQKVDLTEYVKKSVMDARIAALEERIAALENVSE